MKFFFLRLKWRIQLWLAFLKIEKGWDALFETITLYEGDEED